MLKHTLLLLAALSLFGCAEEGPAERAGERLDDAANELADRTEDAVENAGDAVEDFADEVEDELDESTQ